MLGRAWPSVQHQTSSSFTIIIIIVHISTQFLIISRRQSCLHFLTASPQKSMSLSAFHSLINAPSHQTEKKTSRTLTDHSHAKYKTGCLRFGFENLCALLWNHYATLSIGPFILYLRIENGSRSGTYGFIIQVFSSWQERDNDLI